MKKIICMGLVIAMLFSMAAISISAENTVNQAVTFQDVPADHWAYDAIQYFYNQNVIVGMGDETFAPDRFVTREEFAKLLAVIFSRTQTAATEQTFSDVTPDMWSYNYIESVKEFLTGYYPTGAKPFFNPQGKAVREDIAYSLVKIIGLDKDGLKDKTVFDRFTDSDEISPSIKDYVGIAMENGLIRGYEDNTFRPDQGITRAETAMLLFRALKAPVNASPIPTTEPTPVPTIEPTPVPTSSPKPTSTPSPVSVSDYQHSLSSSNFERLSGYRDGDISGNLLLEWSPKENKAAFTANLKLKEGLGSNKCDISMVELTTCTDNKVSGYFKVIVEGVTRDAKIKGTITVSGERLTLTTEPYNYNFVAADCKRTGTEQPDEKVTPEQPDEEENDDEEIWDDAKSVYSSKMGAFKGEGVNGEISGFASVDFSTHKEAVRFKAEVNAKTVTEGDKKFKITLVDTKSFTDAEIKGTFKIICNDKAVAESIAGSITGIDGGLNEKMLFKTDDGAWSLEMYIVERTL